MDLRPKKKGKKEKRKSIDMKIPYWCEGTQVRARHAPFEGRSDIIVAPACQRYARMKKSQHAYE